MTESAVPADELEAAVARLGEPGRFREAEEMVAAAAPGLQAVLMSALGSGGWFGESHQSETLKAATIPDEEERLEAVRSLLNEETHLGMMVGVAVGWALCRELEQGPGMTAEAAAETENGGIAAPSEEQ